MSIKLLASFDDEMGETRTIVYVVEIGDSTIFVEEDCYRGLFRVLDPKESREITPSSELASFIEAVQAGNAESHPNFQAPRFGTNTPHGYGPGTEAEE